MRNVSGTAAATMPFCCLLAGWCSRLPPAPCRKATIYELRESEAVEKQEWVGMDEDMLRRCLDVLVKKGRAQVFGQADGSGVKFF